MCIKPLRSLRQRNDPSFSHTGLSTTSTQAFVFSVKRVFDLPSLTLDKLRSRNVCSRSCACHTTFRLSGVQSTREIRRLLGAYFETSAQCDSPPVETTPSFTTGFGSPARG